MPAIVAKPTAISTTMISAHSAIVPKFMPTARALATIAVTTSVSRSISIGTDTADSAKTTAAIAPPMTRYHTTNEAEAPVRNTSRKKLPRPLASSG